MLDSLDTHMPPPSLLPQLLLPQLLLHLLPQLYVLPSRPSSKTTQDSLHLTLSTKLFIH